MAAERQYETLVRVGIMPSTAAGISQQVEPVQSAISPADIERARTSWYFSSTIPEAMRRMLDARMITYSLRFP